MVYHPHVHFVVPGGGLNADGTKWLSTPTNFLFPEPCASPIYREKFREQLRSAGLERYVDPDVWHRWWEVDVTAVGNGQAVLKYLAPYVFRVAVSDNRIEGCSEMSVTYRYTPSKSKTPRTRDVPGDRFVKGFVQHVLPKGFRKVRHYGWCASNARNTLDRVRWLVWLSLGWTYWLGSTAASPPQPESPRGPRCQHCGGHLKLTRIIDADGRTLMSRPLPNHGVPFNTPRALNMKGEVANQSTWFVLECRNIRLWCGTHCAELKHAHVGCFPSTCQLQADELREGVAYFGFIATQWSILRSRTSCISGCEDKTLSIGNGASSTPLDGTPDMGVNLWGESPLYENGS